MFDKVLMYQFQGSYKTALSIYRYMTSTLSRVDYAQIGTTNYKCLHVIQRSTAADEKEKRGKKQKSIVEGYDKVEII